jgi:uncharacterized protein YjdB
MGASLPRVPALAISAVPTCVPRRGAPARPVTAPPARAVLTFLSVTASVAPGLGVTACDSSQEPAVVSAVVVSPATASLTALGDTIRLSARASTARGIVVEAAVISWSSSAAGIAFVNSTGLVTAVANGAAIIRASSGAISGMAGVTVAQQAVTITVTPATASIGSVGGTVTLSAAAQDARGNPVAGLALAWTSSNPGVASVDGSGRVTAVAGGSATISASTQRVSGSTLVTVSQVATSLTVTPATARLVALGASVQLSAAARDANGHTIPGKRITWSSSAASIATVDTTGKVTAVANGSAIVTAGADGVMNSASVTVEQELASVAITPATASLGTLGRSVQLAASARDARGYVIGGKTFAWVSSSPAIASVNGSGLVTAVANGPTTITATTEGVTGTSEVTVAQKAATVTLTPTGASLTGAGTTRQFGVAARDSGGSAIPPAGVHASWTSLIPGVATVNLSGLAAAVGSGQVTIKVEVDRVVEYATLTVTTPGLPPVNLWARLESGISDRIEGMWGTSASDIYASAHGSHILHYNGTQWRHVFGGIPHGMGLWGSSAHDVYAAGDGKVAHYDGAFWSMVATGVCNTQSGVWGASPVEVFAVCWDGTVVHFDGTSWTSMGSPGAGMSLYGVWGTSARDVFAVGGQHAFHYDGTSWQEISSAELHVGISDVWGVSGSDIYASFWGNVFHFDGAAWTRVVYDAPIFITSVWGSSATDIYFAGIDTLGQAAVLHYNGAQTWTLTHGASRDSLYAIWGAPTGEVFAAGARGAIYRGYRNGTMGINPSSATISGTNNRVRLTALPGAGASQLTGVPITWSSFNPAVAKVDQDGWVTGVASGTATIVAIAFGGAAATANITVDLSKHPPVATIDSPSRDTTVTLGEAVQFRGTASDQDGTIATHTWDFGGGTGGTVEDPPAHTYAAIGNYQVTYRVTDNDGMSSPADVVTVNVVGNQAPTATITSPANQATFAPGATMTFTGSATDHEDGALIGASLVWTSSRDGQIGTGTTFTRNNLSLGTHTITLSATDSQGAIATTQVVIYVSVVAPIVPGEWHGATTGMALDFPVSTNADYVTQMKYTFSGLKCGGAELVSGSVTVSTTPGWAITNRQFVIASSSDNYPSIASTFGDNGTTVTGTWTWRTCSGTWTGSHN